MITITEAGILNAYKNGDDRDRTLIENLVGKDNLKLDITDRVKTRLMCSGFKASATINGQSTANLAQIMKLLPKRSVYCHSA